MSHDNLTPRNPSTELPFDLRTVDGVEQFAKRWHEGLERALNRSAGDDIVPIAYIMVTRSPDTGERLGRPKIVRMAGSDSDGVVATERFADGIRNLALRYTACGVAVMMPTMVAEDVSHEHGIIGIDPDLRAALCVEHMSDEVGMRLWTAVLTKDESWHVGELVERKDGCRLAGALENLLPQKYMQ